MKEKLLKRLSNPYFWYATTGFVYQILTHFGIAPEPGTWQVGVDLVSYAVIGVGIYHTFDKKEQSKGEDN